MDAKLLDLFDDCIEAEKRKLMKKVERYAKTMFPIKEMLLLSILLTLLGLGLNLLRRI